MRRRILSVSIHDCDVTHFRAGGPGGQHQNKRDTGTRVVHVPSGARGEARDERSQRQNKKAAFLRMIATPQFQLWLKRTTGQIAVAEANVPDVTIDPGDLKIEVRRHGRWIVVDNIEGEI